VTWQGIPSWSASDTSGGPSGENVQGPTDPKDAPTAGGSTEKAGAESRPRPPRSSPGPRPPSRSDTASDRNLSPVPDPEAGGRPPGSAGSAASKSKPHSLLSAEAIDEELEKLKASSKVRKRQLKELRKAGALLGDVLARGFLTAYLLHLCAERPRHGNEILHEIEARTEGLWAPSSGGVYTVLRKLEKRGLLEGSWEAGVTRERRVYRVTPAGHDALEEFRRLAPPRIAAASHVLEIVAADLLSGPSPGS